MIIEIPSYKNIETDQTINLDDNISTLIGKNGSGKSTLLESIFASSQDNIIISFSSGQNELFSKIYNNIKRTTFKKIQNIDNELEEVKKYHFDYSFSRILIFLAFSFKNGLIRNYLENSYIEDVDNFILKVDFEIPQYYLNAYNTAVEKEALDTTHYSVRNTYINKYIEKIIEKKINAEYEFNAKINKTNITLNISDILEIFDEKDALKFFTFISLSNIAKVPIFDYKNSELFIKNDLEFEQLSDGEYQLLSIYAILDLFDTENTLFLFDEVDSHLHHSNIKKLWNSLKQISGKAITTTHISESILNNNFENLFYIENGIIKKNLTAEAVTKKLENIIGEKTYSLKVASRIKYIALLDDLDDWIIFKKLAIKKIGIEVEAIFDKVVAFKRESSFNTTGEIFGKSKMIYVNQFKTKNENNSINTKNLFLICDRDKLPLTEINDNLEVQIHSDFSSIKSFNSNNTKTHLLSWRMLEIENYLLSKTMLEEYGKFDDLENELNGVNFDGITTFDESEDLRIYDAKDILHPLYKDGGFDEVKLDEIIDKIPSNEISEDIVKMYEFIKTKIEDN